MTPTRRRNGKSPALVSQQKHQFSNYPRTRMPSWEFQSPGKRLQHPSRAWKLRKITFKRSVLIRRAVSLRLHCPPRPPKPAHQHRGGSPLAHFSGGEKRDQGAYPTFPAFQGTPQEAHFCLTSCRKLKKLAQLDHLEAVKKLTRGRGFQWLVRTDLRDGIAATRTTPPDHRAPPAGPTQLASPAQSQTPPALLNYRPQGPWKWTTPPPSLWMPPKSRIPGSQARLSHTDEVLSLLEPACWDGLEIHRHQQRKQTSQGIRET